MAATSVSVQFILFSSKPCVGHRTSTILQSPCLSTQHQKRNANMQLRCLAEEQPSTPTPLAPPPAPQFSDILAFSGPAPERINGRLAMIGFVAAIGAELAKGDDVVSQLANGGLPLVLGATAVLSLASLIPLFKGVSVESKSKGLMTSDAEMLNGRFAMLGLVALVLTEFAKGGALV